MYAQQKKRREIAKKSFVDTSLDVYSLVPMTVKVCAQEAEDREEVSVRKLSGTSKTSCQESSRDDSAQIG